MSTMPTAIRAQKASPAKRAAWIAMAVLFLCTVSAAFRSADLVYGTPLTEDGYLSLTVARNIAIGRGVTADGRELTNGFQPLWVFATAVWFRLFHGDRLHSVRAVLLTHSVIFIFAAHIWARFLSAFSTTHRDRLYALFVVTYVTSHQLLVESFNGLETGLLLLILGLAVSSYVDSADDRRIRTACLLGILTVVRIDAAIFVALLVIVDFAASTGATGARLKRGVILAGVSALFLLPWLAYGWFTFGSVMPISGQSLTLARPVRDVPLAMYNMGGALVRNLFPTYWGGRFRRLSGLAFIGLLSIVWIGVRRRELITDGWRALDGRARRMRIAAVSLMAFLGALALVYGRDSNAVYFWPRYMVLAAVVGVAVIGTATAVVWSASPRLAACMWALLCLPSLVFVPAWHGVGDTLPLYSAAVSYSNGPLLDQVELVRRYARTGERVGATQSGTLGFFVDGAYNLDGKVSPSALEARKQKALVRYMLDHEIELMVDFQIYSLSGRQDLLDGAEFLKNYRQVFPERYTSEYDLGVFRRIRDDAGR